MRHDHNYSDAELSVISEESYKSEYIIDDPDLLDDDLINDEDVISKTGKIEMDKIVSDQFSNDPKRMVKYHFNWFGLPLSLLPIYYYGRLVFDQVSADLPTAQVDLMPIRIALKIRYLGYLAYFLACLLHRPFVYEFRNAEGPVLVSGILEIYYILNNLLVDVVQPAAAVVGIEAAASALNKAVEETATASSLLIPAGKETTLSILIPVIIACLCFARRKPYLRLLMNPWSKDKSELIKIIQEAKKNVGITDL